MNESIEARVARGAAWLDATKPGWERSVDLAALELSNCCRCVLGHVFREEALAAGHEAVWEQDDGTYLPDSYEWAKENFGLDPTRSGGWPSERLGFSLSGRPGNNDWDALDEAWIALIKERFDSGALSDSP